MASTVEDVASLAGVSKATVSRVLNRNASVSPDTVGVVKEAISSLGYKQPSSSGRGRPRKQPNGLKTGNIAVLFHDTRIDMPLTGALLHGIERAATEKGLNLILSQFGNDGVLPGCISKGIIDGAIVRPARVDINETMAVKVEQKVTAVRLLQPSVSTPSKVDLVAPDDLASGKLAAKHLMAAGLKEHVIINNEPDHPDFLIRCDSFQNAIDELGGRVTRISGEDTSMLVDKLAEMLDSPKGVFIPFGQSYLLSELEKRSIKLGKDINLVSCEVNADDAIAGLKGAAALHMRGETVGRWAVDALLWRLANPDEPLRRTLVNPTLINSNA